MKWQSHAKLISLLLVAGAAGGYWYLSTPDKARVDISAVQGKTPKLTDVRPEMFPTIKIAKIIGWQGNAKPVAAPGLIVNAFADGLDHPRWLHLLPNGDVLVAETTQPERPAKGLEDWFTLELIKKSNGSTKPANRITLLRDTDKDGKADARFALLSAENGLNSPFGMQLVGDTLYVANTDALIAFPYKAGDTKILGKGEKIIALPAAWPNLHWARNIVAAPGGKSLYVTVGSATNIGGGNLENEVNRAAIWEVFPKTKGFRLYATGLRNPNGLAFEPKTGYLWTVVNERDQLGSDSPPDYLTWVDIGTFHGWPWFYWGGYVDSRVQPTNMARQQYSKRPDYALGPHTASLGLAFASRAKLGERFLSGAFIGQHGSWNRSPPSGYKVIFVPFNDRGFAEGKPVDVLSGFLNAKGQAQGRPAGVIVDAEGALLVADDSGNRIWRVASAAPPSAAK